MLKPTKYRCAVIDHLGDTVVFEVTAPNPAGAWQLAAFICEEGGSVRLARNAPDRNITRHLAPGAYRVCAVTQTNEVAA